MDKVYLSFVPVAPPDPSRAVTKAWHVTNLQNDMLGEVRWHSPWRRYVFNPWDSHGIFDGECLREIADFLEVQTIDQMQTWRRPPRRQ